MVGRKFWSILIWNTLVLELQDLTIHSYLHPHYSDSYTLCLLAVRGVLVMCLWHGRNDGPLIIGVTFDNLCVIGIPHARSSSFPAPRLFTPPYIQLVDRSPGLLGPG